MSKSRLTEKNFQPWAVLLLGIIVSSLLWLGLHVQIENAASRQFNSQAQEVVNDIEQRLQQHEQILLGGVGLFDASNQITRDEWHAYVKRLNLEKNYPGILGVGYSELIPPRKLAARIAAVRAEGFPSFTVKPPGDRALYTAIIFLEPFSGRNLAAFGFDMFSEPTRNKAMRRAGETGQTAITGKVKLVQETHGKQQAGFLMYVPVYRKNVLLDTVENRWNALLGFVYSPYRMNDLMHGILGQRSISEMDFVIHDGAESGNDTLMYDSADEHEADTMIETKSGFTYSRPIEAYGHNWFVALHSRPDFDAKFRSRMEWLVLLLGLVISFALYALTRTLVNNREHALALAERMTQELRGSEQRFRSVIENAGDAIYIHDRYGIIQDINLVACKQTGYLHDELVNLSVAQLDAGIDFDTLRDTWDLGEADPAQYPMTLESLHRRKDGSTFPVEIRISLSPTAQGYLFVAMVRDITERKKAEALLRGSEQRFRNMLENCPTAARIALADGHKVIFFNHRYAELLNVDPDKVVGTNPASYYANREVYEDVIAHLARGEQVRDRLVELVIPGFGTKWTVASYFHMEYENQPAILGWFYDITNLKQAETTLQEQAQHTSAILENMIDGIITIDERGIMSSFNPAAERIFGYQPHEVIGQNVKMLMPNPHRDAHDSYLRNYQASGVARIIGIGREVEGQRKDGSLFPMDLAISEIRLQGRPMYVGMVRDITERKRTEQMKSEFVSTVSHELRTPLTSISGALGLLAGGALGELSAQARDMISIAHKNSLRLTHLINDLLDMEKIAAGKLHFDMQPQAIMPLIEQALAANQSYGSERRIKLALQGNRTKCEVRVDSQRMMQIFSNLLSNAIKFSPEDGVVEVSVEELNTQIKVSVRDHGAGIPAAFRERIFQKFAQADSSDTRKKGGTGLGLAITRELAERMGGQVSFESTEGEGTVFHIELPVWNAISSTESITTIPSKGAKRILVVEDEPDVARLLGMMLTRAGYIVDIANTGTAALEALQHTRYAAMTLDLMLPDISGLEIISQLRHRTGTLNMPIIVVSAKMEEGKLAVSGDFSGLDWLAKPVDDQLLLATVENALPVDLTEQHRVLHVEDDADLHQVIRAIVSGRFQFERAATLQEARTRIALERFDVIILDLNLPDGSGWDLLPDIRARQPEARVIIMTGDNVSSDEARKVEGVLLKSQVSPRQLLDTINARIQTSVHK